MYAVSNDYKAAMLSPVQEHDLKGTIGSTAFDGGDVLAGSFSVSNRAMDPTDIKYGSVFIGELTMTVVGSLVTRGTWKGKEITPQIGLKVVNAFEYVQVGIYTVDEAKWSAAGVAITAYDNMIKFDKDFPGTDTYNNLTPYQWLTTMCSLCGVTLGNTQAQIEAMPHGTDILGIHRDNDIKTWRDILSWIAQALAGFATINRFGQLEIRQFGNDTGMSFDATKRFAGAVLEDFVTHYTGVGLELIDQNSYHYVHATPDDGETMKLGPNPLLQHYLAAQIDAKLQPILDELANFEFTPFKASMLGDVAFDLGDVITFTGGLAESGGNKCCIMAYAYKFRNGYSLEGYGDNPALADAKSKTDKYLGGVQSTVTNNSKSITELKESAIRFLLPSMVKEDSIDDGETAQILEWDFQNAEGAEVAIFATIGFEIETAVANDVYTDAELTLTLKLDGTAFETYTQTYGDGDHVLTINHIIVMEVDGIHSITAEISMNGGDLS